MSILLLILLSLAFYWIISIGRKGFLVSPRLDGLVFFRDYLALAIIPYFYYYYGERYKTHYILKNLDSASYFYTAALYATCFIFVFLITYRILERPLTNTLSGFRFNINYYRIIVLLRFFSIFCIFIFIYLSYKYKGGLLSLLSGLSVHELGIKRAQLTGLGFEKIIIKNWIPSISYLYLYLYLRHNRFISSIDKFFMFSIFITGGLAALFFFEKAVIFFYLFGFLGVYVYSGRLIKPKTLIIFGFLGFFIIGLMYLITYGDKVAGLSYLRTIIIHRLMTQSTGSVMALQYFGDNELRFLSGISNMLAELQGTTFKSVYSIIMDYYLPDSVDTSGSMSSFVTGDAYGLFGILGVIFSGLVVGLYYVFFEATRGSNILSIMFVGLYGLFYSHFYVASSFYGFLWPISMIYSIFPFALIALFSTRRLRS